MRFVEMVERMVELGVRRVLEVGPGRVLTGLVAALIGQGLSPFDAACRGVYVHGLAGDMGAKELGEVSLTAWDLIGHLPGAMKTVTTRR